MKILSSNDLKNALISGSNSLINNRGKIDALNVFPVPDGDTGSNMSGTVKSAILDIENFQENHIGNLMKKFARGALLGARGNSGVILSQIFKGFAVALENKVQANTFDIVEAFRQASIFAYKSVLKPIEGTILTVIRMVSEYLTKNITPSNDIEFVFEKAYKASRDACDATPNLLAILKEVGVTDSGGEGLFQILEGMLKSIQGKPVHLKDELEKEVKNITGFKNEEFDGEFGYCTEGVVELKKFQKFDKEKFQYGLEKMGNSIVIVQDDKILKVHIHTLKPGSALNYMQKYGEFLKIKSENMTLQANQSKGQKDSHKLIDENKNHKEHHGNHVSKSSIAVISCNDGQGILDEMQELGAYTIEGGQTNNPSTGEFLKAIEKIGAKNIIILPNNSNIILVAQQVVQTVKDKNVIIIPTKSQAEGIVAMDYFDPDNTLEENQELMQVGIKDLKVGQVTHAIKDTKIDGIIIKKGNYLAIANRKIIASTDSKIHSAIMIIKRLTTSDTEKITLWYGEGATKVDADEVTAFIKNNYDVESEVRHGNQHVYDFLIAIE